MKRINLLILNLLLASIAYCVADNAPNPNATWSLFAYFAADNTLAEDAPINVDDMKKGANQYVNVMGSLHLKNNGQKTAQKFLISNGQFVDQGTTKDVDSGSVVTFTNALSDAVQSTVTPYLMIDAWNHGGGCLNFQRYKTIKRVVCIDDTTGTSLSDADLVSALTKALSLRNGKKIDIIGFDACLMQSIEMATTLADFTNVIVASEETIPALGFNYTPFLSSINQNTDPKTLASTIVSTYKDLYNDSTNDFTLSAVDTSNVTALAKNVDNVAVALVNLLNSSQAQDIYSTISTALSNTVAFEENFFIDLYDFYNNLLQGLSTLNVSAENQQTTSDLTSTLNDGQTLIKQVVFANITGTKLSKAGGISIYFPQDQIDQSYPTLIWTQKYPNWSNFLSVYLNANQQPAGSTNNQQPVYIQTINNTQTIINNSQPTDNNNQNNDQQNNYQQVNDTQYAYQAPDNAQQADDSQSSNDQQSNDQYQQNADAQYSYQSTEGNTQSSNNGNQVDTQSQSYDGQDNTEANGEQQGGDNQTYNSQSDNN